MNLCLSNTKLCWFYLLNLFHVHPFPPLSLLVPSLDHPASQPDAVATIHPVPSVISPPHSCWDCKTRSQPAIPTIEDRTQIPLALRAKPQLQSFPSGPYYLSSYTAHSSAPALYSSYPKLILFIEPSMLLFLSCDSWPSSTWNTLLLLLLHVLADYLLLIFQFPT